jgi:hypothetical protein
LYAELTRRGVVDLDVAFLSAVGVQPVRDPSFGVTLAWDINLLDGYRSTMLGRRSLPGKPAWLASACRWLRRQDVIVLHGHADPDILLASAACRALRVPYVLRGDSHAEPSAHGWRRSARHLVAGTVVRGAAGALPAGERNAGFYRRYAQIPHFAAPYSVDNDRFRVMSEAARTARTGRLEALGLDAQKPTVIFSGKLIEQKRTLDAVRAIGQSGGSFNLLVLGDGPLRAEIRSYERELPVRCLGFVNQAELPRWYGCGDLLVLPSGREPWGLVVNEALHYGCPVVVSDHCGCVPELVTEGQSGYVFKTGDANDLARKMNTVIVELADTGVVAEACLSLIANFNPRRSAEQILHGCREVSRLR